VPANHDPTQLDSAIPTRRVLSSSSPSRRAVATGSLCVHRAGPAGARGRPELLSPGWAPTEFRAKNVQEADLEGDLLQAASGFVNIAIFDDNIDIS
jgi:hypothetical protein